MKIKDLGNGKVRITPDEGKVMMCSLDKKPHSEAAIGKEYVECFYEV